MEKLQDEIVCIRYGPCKEFPVHHWDEICVEDAP